MTRLGTYVQNRMVALGLTVADVKERSGGRLGESAIYMIRRGERVKLQPESWLGLSAALEVSLDELLRLAPPEDGRSASGGGRVRKESVNA